MSAKFKSRLFLLFWIAVSLAVAALIYLQDSGQDKVANDYMARVNFVNGVGPAQPVAVAVNDVR